MLSKLAKDSMPYLGLTQGSQNRPLPERVSEQSLSFSDLVRPLWRQKWVIALCTLASFSASVAYLHLKQPVYQASATLRIDPDRASSLGLNGPAAPNTSDTSDLIHTEIAILGSDAVALRTLSSLPENEFYEFTGQHKNDVAFPDGSEALSPQQQRLVDKLKTHANEKQVEGTQLVEVDFSDPDPKLAADVVNHLVTAYTVQTFVGRDNSVSQLRTWLSAQMGALKRQVDTSQQRLAAFEEANHVIGTDASSNTITDRLRLLNDKLASTQVDRIAKEAALRTAAAGDPGALASLYPNARLSALQAQQASLYASYAQLSAKFGAKYPPLVEIQRQIDGTGDEIKGSVQSVQHRLQQEFDAATMAQNMLQGEYAEQTQLAYNFNRNQAEFAVLQNDVTSSRELYDTLRRELQQASVNAQVNGLSTMPVDSARVPTVPVSPKRTIVLGSGVVLGLFASMVCVLLMDATSDKLHSTKQLSGSIGYPVLGLIPRIRRPKLLGSGNADSVAPLAILEAPESQTAEVYRALRNTLLLSFRYNPPRSLLFMNPVGEYGVNEVAANFATALAQTGATVLLVDADLRRPSLHTQFGIENFAGLRDYLSSPSKPVTFHHPIPGMKTFSLLTAGFQESAHSEMMMSPRLRTSLEKWELEFEYVVLVCSPLLTFSDGLPLASWVAANILVAQYNKTTLRELHQVQNLLSRTEARVAGVLVKDAPPSDAAYIPYGEFQYA